MFLPQTHMKTRLAWNRQISQQKTRVARMLVTEDERECTER
jgi:hypothetical protein